MALKTILISAAAFGLASAPAFAGGGGFLGSSGNAGGLMGGGGQQWGGGKPSGGPQLGPQDQHPPKGGEHGGQPSWSSSEGQSHKSYSSEHNSSQKSFNQRDTTLGGFEANPQLAIKEGSKSHEQSYSKEQGCKCGGSSVAKNSSSQAQFKSLNAAFPIKVNDTTLGGFESSKSHESSSKAFESSKSFSNRSVGAH